MAINLDDVGVQSHTTTTLCESVDYETKTDQAMISACDSTFGAAEAFDPITEFSLRGKGDIDVLLVIGGDGSTAAVLTDINDGLGTRILSSVKEDENNTEFNGWEVSGTYFPGAT